MAFDSVADGQDSRFFYEPLLSAHPKESIIPETIIGNKKLKLPLWVSSMTGGSEKAGVINHRIARACGKFGIGMGLGSCRIILEDDKYFPDFDLRDELGNEVPFMANLGIAQIEKIVQHGDYKVIEDLLVALRADGVIIHVNPLQEWLQPEGDRISQAPIETISNFIKHFNHAVWVKEVGQGMGRKSLEELIKLPISGLEFGAFGGTNFAKMESLRNSESTLNPLSHIGHTANEMVDFLNELYTKHPQHFNNKIFVISGGIKNFLDGYYFIHKLKANAIYAQASPFLKYALESAESVEKFIESEKRGLMAAYSYLTLR